jgi:hypothetical protein
MRVYGLQQQTGCMLLTAAGNFFMQGQHYRPLLHSVQE